MIRVVHFVHRVSKPLYVEEHVRILVYCDCEGLRINLRVTSADFVGARSQIQVQARGAVRGALRRGVVVRLVV